MAAFDVAGALRWARFDPGRTLARRPDAALPFAGPEDLAGRPLLLDTCVYIDQMQGRAPDLLGRLVTARQVNHASVAVQELMHAVGRLDPADPRTRASDVRHDARPATAVLLPQHRDVLVGAVRHRQPVDPGGAHVAGERDRRVDHQGGLRAHERVHCRRAQHVDASEQPAES